MEIQSSISPQNGENERETSSNVEERKPGQGLFRFIVAARRTGGFILRTTGSSGAPPGSGEDVDLLVALVEEDCGGRALAGDFKEFAVGFFLCSRKHDGDMFVVEAKGL